MRINDHKFTFGSDPELFLQTKEGKFVNPSDVTKGTKRKPQLIASCGVQADGLALEINTPPSPSLSYSMLSFNAPLKYILSKHSLVPVIKPFVEFPEEFWNSIPEESKVLGCDPDYNAYTLRVNDAPQPIERLRTAAGHIHIGWGSNFTIDDSFHKLCSIIVKELDAHIGIYSVIHDPDNTRRKMYGKAGAYRPKPYGVEYRVPSNFWIQRINHTRFFDILLSKAINRLFDKELIQNNEVPEIINTGDVKAAQEFFKHV